MARRFSLPALLALILALGGCSPRATTFVHPEVDFGRIRRCAILPFQNLSTDRSAGTRVEALFLTELLRAGNGLTLVEPGETVAALRELRFDPAAPLSPAQIVALGKRLGTEGIFTGTVMDCGPEALGRNRVYVVTAEFGLLETETGVVVWKCEVHGSGSSVWRKLFGGDSASLYAVSRDVVRKALGSLF
jgi:hypothetical protein